LTTTILLHVDVLLTLFISRNYKCFRSGFP